jgi:threonine aldolase
VTDIIDLRSDTVTMPPPEMRRAMYEAELGDDVYGEDPTVNRLQERAAEITGKQAAMFVTSGTQGNLVSVLTHCSRGDEIIVGSEAHLLHYEVGGASALAGTQVRTVPNEPDGTMDIQAIAGVIRDRTDVHNPYTRLICLENTQNRCGGVVLGHGYTQAVGALAHANDAYVHLDGARLFNAAVALGIPAAEVAAGADSVTFCASKGLAAPVGSVLCGTRDFIDRAHRWRKVMGGGMRQAGVIAAGALYALDNMVERLADDHRLARTLASALAAMPGIAIDPACVQTNIIIFSVEPSGYGSARVIESMKARGVLSDALDGQRIRVVTHYGVEDRHIDQAISRIAAAMREL